MRVNIKFFLTWLPCLDFWWKELIKFRNSLNITAWLISIIGMIKLFSDVKSIIVKYFYKQIRKENIASKTDIVFFVFVATGNVIIGITEIYNSVISHTLIIKVNVNRSYIDNRLNIAAFI